MSDQQPNNSNNKALPNKNAASKPTNTPWFILMAVLIIAALVFAQYRIEILLRNQSALEQQLQSVTQQSQQQAIESGKQLTQYEQSQKALTEMQGQLAFMQHTLNQIPGARLDDWKLAETEYLLRLANQRVYLQNELKGAHGLFDAANQVLASLDDPALLVIREQIAKEMLLLGQHSQLDRQGIYSELQALKALIHDSIQPPNEFTANADVTPTSTGATSEQTMGLWQQLLSLVSIRHRDEAFSAPLSDNQYQLLEHNLNLMLEQAQWALLKADNSTYQSSLISAQEWISKNIRHSNANVVLEKITALSKINVEQTAPQVSESLRLLRQLLQERTYAPSAIKTEEENDSDKNNAPKNIKPKKTETEPAPLKDAPQLNTNKQEKA
ncbi:MAG: uroporphyrinogen-III C-methyltransferase [Bermanella sp.]